jgi:hypothetical protein
MHRFGMALGFVGVAVWCVAQTLLAIAIWFVVAVPFGVLLVFDALAREPVATPNLRIVPPAPPRQPIAARPERLAA